MQKFENLKVGMCVKLKKLEDWEVHEDTGICSGMARFGGNIVSVRKIYPNGLFQIKEDRFKYSYALEWIDHIVEFEQPAQTEKVKTMQNLKPGDVVRFPTKERYLELLKSDKWKGWTYPCMVEGLELFFGKTVTINKLEDRWCSNDCFSIKEFKGRRFPEFIFEKIETCESENFEDFKVGDFVRVVNYEKLKEVLPEKLQFQLNGRSQHSGKVYQIHSIKKNSKDAPCKERVIFVEDVEEDMSYAWSFLMLEKCEPEKNLKVQKFEDLKVGDRVKLKKLEDWEWFEELEIAPEMEVFSEKVVTVCKIDDKGFFQVSEDSEEKWKWWFSPEWIEYVVQPEKSTQTSNSEKIFSVAKNNSILRTFENIEECEKFFLKESENLQKNDILQICQTLKVAKLEVCVESLKSKNLRKNLDVLRHIIE